MTNFKSAPIATAAFISLVLSLVLATFSTTHGAADKQDVRVVNTAAEPVPTRNVDEPARQPFQTTVQITIPHLDSVALGFVAVPTGKRLVVEFMSVHGNVLHDRTLLVEASTLPNAVGEVFHELALNDPRPFGNDIYTASQPVRIYAEEQLTLHAQHSGAPAEPALDSHVSIGISGYLIDIP